MIRAFAAAACCLAAVVGTSTATATAGGHGDDKACAKLAKQRLPDTKISSASAVTGGTVTPPGGEPIADLPPFCRVVAVSEPTINFEVWLPLRGYNGRFQGVGNGGTAGTISYDAMATALRDGFATASTDTGHGAGDTTWFTDPRKLDDHGYRAIHVMTVHAKALTRAFYRRAPRYAYFNGCSTGGGQGFSEAQRFPADYDGILSGAPNYRRARLPVSHVYSWQATHMDPAAALPPATVAAIAQSVLDKGDRIDGVADGLIENPLHVRWDPAELASLSPAQVEAVRKLYAGPRNPRTGEQLYPGFVPGVEAGWSAIVGAQPYAPAYNIFRLAIFRDPDYDFRTFDFDRDVALTDRTIANWSSESTDLRPFAKRGGRMLVYHGWSDWGITPRNTLDYRERLQDRYGSHRVGDFWRLFMIPGMGHCSGGPGTDRFDGIGPLMDWVEKGRAPKRIPAAHATDGVVDRTRPLCLYPSQAVYRGRGSTDDQRNFDCRTVHRR